MPTAFTLPSSTRTSPRALISALTTVPPLIRIAMGWSSLVLNLGKSALLGKSGARRCPHPPRLREAALARKAGEGGTRRGTRWGGEGCRPRGKDRAMPDTGRVPNDLGAFWMPFTANRQFKANPRMLVAAQGMHYTAQDGRKILDGTAGLWCCNAGHGHPKIVAAIQRQAALLDYAPAFQMGHPKVFELAGRLSAMLPGDLDHVFFTNSGSEAVDTALKLAIAYHRVKGEGARTRLIGRERGYHGVGFGGISVGGITNNRKFFGPLLAGVDHLPHTHLPERNAFSRGQPAYGAHLADELLRIVQLHDPSTIAAVIVEPVAASTGVLIPPQGYLTRLREICDRFGILLIFDEVITGFGRLGTGFAVDRFAVQIGR